MALADWFYRKSWVCLQGCWWDESALLTLPGMTPDTATELQGQGLRTLSDLANLAARDPQRAHDMLQGVLGSPQRAQEAMQASSVFVHTTVYMHVCVRLCMSLVISHIRYLSHKV